MAKTKLLTADSLLVISPEIIDSEIDEEIIMMNVDSGTYFGLDDIASDIWKKLKDPIRLSDLVVSLMDSYDVEEQQCLEDITPLLEKMLETNIIKLG